MLTKYIQPIRTKALEYKQNQRCMRKLCFYSVELMLFTYLPITTFICLCVAYLSAKQFIHLFYINKISNGLIYLLPHKIQSLLLNRSVFDILCDIWFIPKLSLYIKAFFRPFLEEITPNMAYMALDELPDNARQLICKKGLINILPEDIQNALVPSTTDCSNHISEHAETPISRNKPIRSVKSRRVFKEDSRVHQFIMPWTIFRKQDDDTLSAYMSSESDYSKKKNLQITHEIVQLPEEQLQFSKNIEIVVPNRNIGADSVQWDKIDTFQEKQHDDTVNQKAPIKQIQRVASLVLKIVHFQQSSRAVLAIDNMTLVKVFAISTAALTVQSILSKRTRKVMVQSMIVVFYLGCAGVSTGALGLYVFKLINNKKKNK